MRLSTMWLLYGLAATCLTSLAIFAGHYEPVIGSGIATILGTGLLRLLEAQEAS